MTYFVDKDTFWESTASFLALRRSKKTRILAPKEFINILDGVVAYELLAALGPSFFDFVVIHKGLCHELGRHNIETWMTEYNVAFANDVFVVFSKIGNSLISRDSDHYKSLINQLNDLPDFAKGALIEKTGEPEKQLDYRPVVDFINDNCHSDDLIVVPETIRELFPNAIDENFLFNTSIDTVEFAIISILSAANFPYQDLKNMVVNYAPIYSDNLFVVYAKNAKSKEKTQGLHQALITAIEEGGFEWSYKLYRFMIIGE